VEEKKDFANFSLNWSEIKFVKVLLNIHRATIEEKIKL